MGIRPDYQRGMSFQVTMNYSPFDGNPGSDSSEDCELLENMSFAVKSLPKNTTSTINRISRRVTFVLRNNKKIEQLMKQLNYWNDRLDKTSRLEQESSRRRLRTYLSSGNTTQLQYLEAAAALFQHKDLEKWLAREM